MQIDPRLAYAALAAVPLLLTPGLFFVLSEGWIDLGGGEKDILFALPYFVWALIFFVVSVVLIVKRWPLRRWVTRASAASVLPLMILWAGAYVTSWLRVS